MNKHLKAVISVLLAFVIFASTIPADAITAFAAGKLSIDIDYDYYGTAFVTLTPGDSDNYVTYTTDGSVPDENSEKYKSEIVVYSKMILRVAEYTPDGERVKGLKTTVKAKTAPVIFEIKQLGGKAEVTMSCATYGAEIRYTTDGSKPSQKSELYTDKLVLTEKTKIRARAYCEDYKTTKTYAKTVRILSADELEEAEDDDDNNNDKPASTSSWNDPFADSSDNNNESDSSDNNANDTENPDNDDRDEDEDESEDAEEDDDIKIYAAKASYGGDLIRHNTIQVSEKAYTYVELVAQKSSNKIVYTTDDSSPKEGGKKYSKRFKITKPTIIRAIEYNKAGDIVASLRFTAKVKCAPVTFECVGIDREIRTLKFSTLTEGASIYYTTNGKFPTTDSKLYTGEVDIAASAQIKAIAVKDGGYIKSNVSSTDAGAVELNLPEVDLEDENIQYLYNEINERRRRKNLPPLMLSEGLCRAAAVRAIEIQAFDSFNRPSGGTHLNAAYDAGILMAYSMEYRYRHFDGLYQIPTWLFEERTMINDKDYYPDAVGIGYCVIDGVQSCIIIVGKIQD